MTGKILTTYKQKIASLELMPGSGGCFELAANGKLLYSKLATGQFPNEEALVQDIGRLLKK